MKAGAGKARITPPAGVPFLGHGHRVSEGIHDDLWAKVMVLDDGREAVAIVALDLCWPMPDSGYIEVRKEISERTGMDERKILVSCTHCHSGPDFVARKGCPLPIERQRELIEPWVEELPGRIAHAAELAREDMREARISFGKSYVTGISYNRRKRIPEGVAKIICDTGDMEHIVRKQYESWGMSPEEAYRCAPLGIPDGPIDPDLPAMLVEDVEGRTIGVLTNFACHAVACAPPAPYLISAGFPGYMTRFVEKVRGGVCLFTTGAGGDIRPYRSSPRGFEEAERIGLVLASMTLKALREAEPVEEPRIDVAWEEFDLPLRKYPPPDEIEEVIKEKERSLEEAKAKKDIRKAKRLSDEITTLRYAMEWGWVGQGEKVKAEVQAIRLGDILMVTLPGEVNVGIGLAIKQKASTDKFFLITLANGMLFYIISREEYDEGGYEAATCRLAPGAGERVVEVASGLVEKLKRRCP